ncbi:hypothetical protein [Lentilactobacillus senioris]|uniref:hypothetical protein n=1 Tax=Lentilactobacillus senioris TaxID=931534 RepID=UPI003D2C5E87
MKKTLALDLLVTTVWFLVVITILLNKWFLVLNFNQIGIRGSRALFIAWNATSYWSVMAAIHGKTNWLECCCDIGMETVLFGMLACFVSLFLH